MPSSIAQDLGSATFLELPAANPRTLMDGSLKLEYESQMELPHYFRILLEMGSKQKGRNEECVYKVR